MTSNYKFHHHDANYLREFNTEEFYNNIEVRVVKNLKRSLTQPEKKQIVGFIRKVDPQLLKHKYKEKTITSMVSSLTKEFSKFDVAKPVYNDTQQFLRDTIGLSSESNTVHSIYDRLSKKVNVKKIPKKNYILLDSRYRVDNAPNNIKKFTWSFNIGQQQSSDGSVNVVGNIRDIVAMRVYPCRIPYIASADNKYARVSMLIEEMESQAFIAHETRKFHYMFESKINGDFIDLVTDKFNDGWFHFEKPITSPNALSITFGSPLEQIVFERDRDWCGIDYFGITPLTQITTENNHNLNNGDSVYFSLFTVVPITDPALKTLNDINNTISADINRKSGFIVSVIDATNFSIDYDSKDMQSPTPNVRFRVFYGSKRVFIPIELTYMKPEV
jgi:hypothetical protein